MKNKVDWDLILLYLEGGCSEAEERIVLAWLEENEENRKELELLRKIWNSPDITLPDPNVEKALNDVKQRISAIKGSENLDNKRTFKVNTEAKKGS